MIFLKRGEAAAAGWRLKIPLNRIKNRAGERLGTGLGNSLEFQEYRDYQPGDDLRHMDWRIYGKTDRLIVKRYREEIQPLADIITDFSLSMQNPYGEKRDSALFLSAFLLRGAMNAGALSAWWSLGLGLRRLLPYSLKPGTWPETEFAGKNAPFLSLTAGCFKNNSIRIVISDFLWEEEPEMIIQCLREGASALFLVMILTREEQHPSLSGYHTLVDAETGREMPLYASREIIAAYRERLERHLDLWKAACEKFGAVFCLCGAEDILKQDISALLREGIIETV